MLVYELTLITAGYTFDYTSSFAQRVGSLVSSSIADADNEPEKKDGDASQSKHLTPNDK